MKLRNLKLWAIASLVTFTVGVIATVLVRRPARVEQRSDFVLTLKIPKRNWEETYLKPINAVARYAGESELKTTVLNSGDHEARIWWGFGLSPLEGVILRYIDGQWSAIHVMADNYYAPTKATRDELPSPKSGWDTVWNQLVTTGILTLPDSTDVDCDESGIDGVTIVIETNFNQTYRSYRYSNPSLKRCAEAQRVDEMTNLIDKEFRHDWRK